jgi:phosphopantothenoylcysteine decarboxylase/phosphopantothenate--cysteine ligase
MHPADEIRGERSSRLKGRTIVLGITGSIAAVESFALARELVRHDANVVAVMSPDALEFITEWSMHFATGNEVIKRIDGRVQHVALLGEHAERAEMLLVAPATANTISKMALGIDDTSVTTMATIAIGSGAKVLVAPAMHLAMYRHPAVMENVRKLGAMGVELIGPYVSDGRAKVASKEEIVSRVLRALGPRDLEGKKVLVIGGAAQEAIDDMRVISNRSSGESSVELALAAYERGATVELWMGTHRTQLPAWMTVRRFESGQDLLEMVNEIDHDLIFVPAALSDFGVEKVEGKISSDRPPTLRLRPLPKVIESIPGGTIIAYKAESGVGEEELISRARSRMSNRVKAIVANDLKEVGAKSTRAYFVTSSEVEEMAGTKREVADMILDNVKGLFL